MVSSFTKIESVEGLINKSNKISAKKKYRMYSENTKIENEKTFYSFVLF